VGGLGWGRGKTPVIYIKITPRLIPSSDQKGKAKHRGAQCKRRKKQLKKKTVTLGVWGNAIKRCGG